jgi:uncharacterized cupin superfamily protein
MNTHSITALPTKNMLIQSTGEALGRAILLSKVCGLDKFFVWQEELPPGHRASSPHYHTEKEEMIVLLSGSLRVQCGDLEWDVTAGQCVGFKPSERKFHVIKNISDKVAVYLGIASNSPDDEVIYQSKN